jgi:hypothetical protein
MDFFIRKKIFVFSLIFLAVFFLMFFLIFYFFSPGFLVSSNLNLDLEKPILIINLKNDSLHVVENINIIINDKLIFEPFNLMPKDENKIELVVTEENLTLEIFAENHLKYDKSYTLKGAISKNSLEFYPEYIFNKVNELSDLNLEICNIDEEMEFFVEIETDADIVKGYEKQDVILELKECKILNYHLLYKTEGNKRVKFKIYNDIYSKELSINGMVS